MKRILFILSYFLYIFALIGCPSPVTDTYYVAQQSKAAKDDSTGGPNIDWGDGGGDGNGSGDGGSSGGAPPPLAENEISKFSALQPDGAVIIAEPNMFAGKMGGSDDSYAGYVYDTSGFDNWKILGNFSAKNVPNLWYKGEVNWGAPLGDGSNRQSFNGPTTTAGPNNITDMVYYRYAGVNPFFGSDSSYNTAEYELYNEAGEKTGGSETLMKRFIFYRFSGKGGGVAALDNMLVAVDTYTKLIFAFAKPTKWGSLLGNAVPLEWGPVDLCSTGPGGKQYKFYEYDPVGYVTKDNAADGTFHMTATYQSNQESGKYDPEFTGKSPYLGVLIKGEDGNISSGGGSGGGTTGYKVNGTLTVKAKYIENPSQGGMTDSWGDNNFDSTDSPEFIYSIRSRAYGGFDAVEWNAMSFYKPDDTGMSPSGAKTIKKGATLQLGGGKQYIFKDEEDGLTLELDSRIIEIDISGNDSLTDYETPIIFLGYDRYSQKWAPSANNNTYLRGPLEYDENFQIGLGETKDFVVTVPAGWGEKIELCYEISWQSDSDSDAGRIFSAQVKNTGKDYLFSGSNGEYDIKYVDLTAASSLIDKTASIELSLGNLHSEVPITVEYVIASENVGFIGGPASAFDVITADEPKLLINIPLRYHQDNTQEGTLTLKLIDSSGSLGMYDVARSPQTIVINIIREKFISISTATLEISNLKLKNLSVMDVGGDQPSGGYDQPEFSWNIKTRHNESEWKELSANNGTNVIKTNSTRSLGGIGSHRIENPREGAQTVDFSAAITERDSLASNADDVMMKHEQPLIKFGYNPLSDSWNLIGKTTFYFTDGNDMQWQIKKITMNDVERDKKAQKVTISLSSYIWDTIWPNGNIADIINGPITAGWGDMELTFDVKWESE